MAKHTIVSIYEVDESGATGAHVGEGSLVDPRLVLLHPPLSDQIAAQDGFKRLRVELRSNSENGSLVEVLDGRGHPRALWTKESVGSLVGLELDTAATSPVDWMNGLEKVGVNPDRLLKLAVDRLASPSTDEWNSGFIGVEGWYSNLTCLLFGWLCLPLE